TTEIYTLSLHDALPISGAVRPDEAVDLSFPHGGREAVERLHAPEVPFQVAQLEERSAALRAPRRQHRVESGRRGTSGIGDAEERSEEHTSELQSLAYLV